MAKESGKILVTGGAGYIGSHTVVSLLESGYEVVVIDNLVNSSKESIRRAEQITGKSVTFVEGDVCCLETLREVFSAHKISAVIHFAGLKAVGESVTLPLAYYDNNIKSTLSLLSVMREFQVQKFVFSSSATVYNDPSTVCYDEATTKTDHPSSPYGTTKLMQEWIIEDAVKGQEFNEAPLQAISLRYFNPVGAHPCGKIGEDPKGIPNNLTPYITQVAVGRREFLSVWGNDYPTPDGTCVRDYIHVMDLARGHLNALQYLETAVPSGEALYDNVNLGSGKGNSVLEVINAFEKATGSPIPYKIAERRTGDLPEFFAKPDKALKLFGFKTELSFEQMAVDAWNWQKQNPQGYGD